MPKETNEFLLREESFFEKLAFRAAKNLGSSTSLLIHTILFIGIFSLNWFDFGVEQILLILTTLVSLEAIYMSIFIQMTVNRHAEGLSEVHQHIEEISDDVDEIQEDIEDIQTEVKEIGDDVDEISEDIDDIQEDVKDISEDVEDISEEMEEDDADKTHHDALNAKLYKIEETLHKLLTDIESLKK
jgi:uncharacterized protein YoxC